MTFHAFQRSRRLGMALGRMRSGGNQAGTAYDHGYESLSGFREAFERLFGAPPGRKKSATQVVVTRYLTPLGPMLAAATGCEFVAIENDDMVEAGIDRVIGLIGDNKPVIVDVRIDYSKKTQFTIGAVRTNLKRFDTRNKIRIVSRALWRKLKGR